LIARVASHPLPAALDGLFAGVIAHCHSFGMWEACTRKPSSPESLTWNSMFCFRKRSSAPAHALEDDDGPRSEDGGGYALQAARHLSRPQRQCAFRPFHPSLDVCRGFPCPGVHKTGPYEGGVWRVNVQISDGYPYRSPSIGGSPFIFLLHNRVSFACVSSESRDAARDGKSSLPNGLGSLHMFDCGPWRIW
jgi:hypothetical protein